MPRPSATNMSPKVNTPQVPCPPADARLASCKHNGGSKVRCARACAGGVLGV